MVTNDMKLLCLRIKSDCIICENDAACFFISETKLGSIATCDVLARIFYFSLSLQISAKEFDCNDAKDITYSIKNIMMTAAVFEPLKIESIGFTILNNCSITKYVIKVNRMTLLFCRVANRYYKFCQ